MPQEFWNIDVALTTEDGDEVITKFFGDKKGKMRIENAEQANEIAAAIRQGTFRVTSVKHAERQKMPAPPFTTSTLQQEGSRRLGFQTQKIMKVAQELYDGLNLGAEFGGVQGLITYMRTDSLRIAASAQESALSYIRDHYGAEYLPKTPRVYRANANAQDAHEAIRPANVQILPKQVRKHLTSDQYKLYKLIWERFVASQMEAAVLDTVLVNFENAGYTFRTSGYTVKFRGFMDIYSTSDDEEIESEMNFTKLPVIKKGAVLQHGDIVPAQHFTEPPARYTEASLVKFLEENGIGRPSTYAPIISIILSREYVKRDGKALVATPLGELTTKYMSEHFPEIVDYEFTASMEKKLDSIEQRETTTIEVLSQFYTNFERELLAAEGHSYKQAVVIPVEESDVLCDKCGSKMIYKNGRFGKFLACPNYPACRNTKAVDKNGAVMEKVAVVSNPAGFTCELCGGEMVIRSGRFGDFYACANYPTCTYTKQKVTSLGVPCPKCGGDIVARHGKGRMLFYSCTNYPECDYSSWDMPLAEKCPDCGQLLFYRKSRKSVICKNRVCDYKREEEIDVGE